jgi:signal transduction histidine kinase
MPFPSIDDPVKLSRVIEATMLLRADLELPVLLGHVIEEARSLTGARFGALGILNSEGTAIAEFLTVGLTRDEEARIGPRPTGEGVLGLLLSDPQPLRLAQLGEHPQSSGFPENHPPMRSFLGVPIEVRNEVYGSLYLTDKIGSYEFSGEDQALVEALAVAAGMVIENARLHQRVQELAVIEERDRMARDLHDTVVQHLYAVGISLETMAQETEAEGIADRLAALVSDVGDAIRQVRSSIYELGLDEEDPGVRAGVLTLVRSLTPMLGFNVRVSFDGPIDSVISQSVTEQLLATIREAVTNIGRHAQATEASVTVSAHHGLCRLRVVDNGIGLDAAQNGEAGLGLVNLRRRAEKMHGTMDLATLKSGGTVLEWEVPVSQ